MSTSQLGEFPHVCQKDVNIPSQSFQDFSGGISFVVGRKSWRYLIAVDIDLSAGHNMGFNLSNISAVESSEK